MPAWVLFKLVEYPYFMASASENDSVGRLLEQFRTGSRAAAGELVQALYPELRRLAASKMKGERLDHSWQPTALVNELYLQLIQTKGLNTGATGDASHKHMFYGLAGHMMKRLLIHHARPLSRRVERVPIEEAPEHATGARPLQEVEEALDRLGAIHTQLKSIVEMKVFEGMSVDEIAERLNCSPRTVARDWNFAKHWLAKEFDPSRSL